MFNVRMQVGCTARFSLCVYMRPDLQHLCKVVFYECVHSNHGVDALPQNRRQRALSVGHVHFVAEALALGLDSSTILRRSYQYAEEEWHQRPECIASGLVRNAFIFFSLNMQACDEMYVIQRASNSPFITNPYMTVVVQSFEEWLDEHPEDQLTRDLGLTKQDIINIAGRVKPNIIQSHKDEVTSCRAQHFIKYFNDKKCTHEI